MFEYVIVAPQITWSEDWNLGSMVAKAKEEWGFPGYNADEGVPRKVEMLV